jgi:hypothetical protein
MAGLELLARYEIDLSDLNLAALVKLRGEYETINNALIGDKDKQESKDSELKKYLLAVVSEDDEVTETVKNFVSEVRHMFYTIVDNDPRTIMPLVEAISELKTDVLNERDHWLNKVKRESAPVKVIDEDYENKRAEAAEIAELIRQLYPLLSSLVPTDKRGDEFGPVEFPLIAQKESGKATGKFLPKLTKLARSQNEDNPTGRAAQNRYLQFTWNGNVLPEGTLPSDVAHDFVSDFKAGFVIDWTGIRDLAKKDGVEMFGDKPWTHDFPTGSLTIQDVRPNKPERK